MNDQPDHAHSRTEVAPYLAHYRGLIDRVGAVFEATGWRSKAFQTTRFDVFSEMVDFTGLRVLDAGAGRGDFAAYLTERGVGYREIVALDAMPEMVETINGRGLPGVSAHRVDFAEDTDAFVRTGPVDAVVFSGSLNTLTQEHALGVLGRAWDAAGLALIFNFLSDRAPRAMLEKPTGPAHRFDTVGMIEWALERTPGVRFRQDYLGGHDATVVMLRE